MTEATRLGRNFSALAVAQLLSQVLTLVLSIVLARTLGVTEYGIFVFGFAFPSWFLILASLGLDPVLAIDVAADRERASTYLTTIALLRLPLVGAAFGALWIAIHLILTDPFAITITLILGAASILQTYAGTFTAVFRAFERLEFTAVVTIAERVFTTALVLTLLFLGFGLYPISLVFLVGALLMLTLALGIVRARFARFTRDIPPGTLSAIVHTATPFALFLVINTFTDSTGPVLLTLLQSPEATGQFNAAFAILFAFLSFLSLYHMVLLPTMSRLSVQRPGVLPEVLHRTQKLFFILGLPIAVGGWRYAEEIMVLFYGEAFRISGASFAVLIFTVAITAAVLGSGTVLAATGRQDVNLTVGGVQAALTVGLSLLLIPVYGPPGAAYAVLLATLVWAILIVSSVRRLIARVGFLATYARTLLAGGVLGILLLLLPGLPLWAGIPLGGSLYFGMLLLLNGITPDDWSLLRQAVRGALFR